ncbi:aminopeptidase-like protein Y [Microdochium trichocladiopsis]|uniref:Peptide hydrolase n=1 Tax=Microdochium trichocladiopsis TaxID=1682393 RepID=A0A9P8YFV7_9PEZI|nr:aminopeptidase-like protein Y [Microdochium trichocladiopsis]KAH7039756.1 aminopeptidase-like protein Y [Microdochium trichocladiopsis]
MAARSLLLLAAAASAAVSSASALDPVQRPLGSQHSTESILATKRPLVDSQKLQDSISIDALVKRAEKLFDIAKLSEHEYNHPTRVIGSAGHVGTLKYIEQQIAELGDYYHFWNQSFPAISGRVNEHRLVIGNDVSKSGVPMQLTPPTKDKEPVHGDLVLVDNEGCDESDYPKELKGNIAFILRGTCAYGTKSELAGKAGAKAAIVYNYDHDVIHGTLGSPTPNQIATFSLSGDEAAPIIKDIKAGKTVDAIAYIDADVITTITTNLLAQTVEGDPDNCVMLGGHSDSVTAGPGINDDGSGSLSILEVATQLTKFSVNNCVRFAWWAGEEEGLLGSDYYVSVLPEDENKKIRLFMDYDMMGSPNFAYQIYNATNAANPVGSEELRDLYIDWYEVQGLNYTFIPFDGRSDYDGFIRNGIPGGGIATGAEGIKTEAEVTQFGGKAGDWYDPCYHQLCDDVGNVNATAWEVNTKLIAHSVATYALSFDGFPKRTDSSSLGATVESAYEKEVKYHGTFAFI